MTEQPPGSGEAPVPPTPQVPGPPVEEYEAPLPPPAAGDPAFPPPVAGYDPTPAGTEFAPPPPAPPVNSGAQWPGAANLQDFDPKTVDVKDWAIIGLGVLTLLFSIFGYYKYTVTVKILNVSRSESQTFSAWHGFFGWFAAILAVAAAIVLALNLIMKVSFKFPVRLYVLGAFALATLCTLLALFIVPGVKDSATAAAVGIKIDKGHGFSYWLSFIFLIAATVLSYLRFTETGGKLPKRG